MKTAAAKGVLRVGEAARALGVSVGTLANWRSLGIGPRWSKGHCLVYYDRAVIERWKSLTQCPECGQPLTHLSRKARES